MERLIELYRKYKGEDPAATEKMAGAGSNRSYFRIIGRDGSTIVGVVGTSREENHAFVYLSRHFEYRRLPVPRVLAVADDEMCYLQEDLVCYLFSMPCVADVKREADITRERSNCSLRRYANCPIYRYGERESWIGATAIRSRSLMFTQCYST